MKQVAILSTDFVDQGQAMIHIGLVALTGESEMQWKVLFLTGPERGQTRWIVKSEVELCVGAFYYPKVDWKALAEKLAIALSRLADAAPYKLDVETPYFEAQTVLVEYRAAIAKAETPPSPSAASLAENAGTGCRSSAASRK